MIELKTVCELAVRRESGRVTKAIAAVRHTARVRVSLIGRAAAYGLMADHGGHGIGRAMHEDPHVPDGGRADGGAVILTGPHALIDDWESI
ncbi:hypothetical protein [Nocardia lijiangensis]|uniref:hypothetical protein n=1 Tax=Nocardia lijiangensis TaxID=299618 RepID=UPI003D71AD59